MRFSDVENPLRSHSGRSVVTAGRVVVAVVVDASVVVDVDDTVVDGLTLVGDVAAVVELVAVVVADAVLDGVVEVSPEEHATAMRPATSRLRAQRSGMGARFNQVGVVRAYPDSYRTPRCVRCVSISPNKRSRVS